MLPSPLFFPPAIYSSALNLNNATKKDTKSLCDEAGITCKASGAWTKRKIFWEPSERLNIYAKPGYCGEILIGIPQSVIRHGKIEIARYLLQVMAYSELFDGVARESIKGLDWSRNIKKPGRPKKALKKSNAKRQREWRQKNKK